MERLLHPIKFDRQFEYEIKKGEQLYVAGIRKVKLNSDAKLAGKLYLDELSREIETRRDSFLALPLFPSPNYNPIYSVTKEKRRNVFSINPIVIDEELNQFIINIQLGLIKQHHSRMNNEDINHFFNRIYQHYIENQLSQ